jgi:hypothetical protein
MTGERSQPRRNVLRRVAIGAVIFLVVAIPVLFVYGQIRGSQRLREFGELWNTTDAISIYMNDHHKWPRNWEALSSSLAAVGAGESNLQDSVVVNFDVDYRRMPQPGDWYVHLKNGDIPGEEQIANERLRQFIAPGRRPPQASQ